MQIKKWGTSLKRLGGDTYTLDFFVTGKDPWLQVCCNAYRLTKYALKHILNVETLGFLNISINSVMSCCVVN